MAEVSIPVDLLNPGQVFACLGFVEAAVVLFGAARGGFNWQNPDHVQFRLSVDEEINPVRRVLRFLNEATVTSLTPINSNNNTKTWKIKTVPNRSGSFPFSDPSSPATLPACLTDSDGNSIIIDHWGDETHRRDSVKFWAGSCGYPGAALARDALRLIRNCNIEKYSTNPFSLSAEQTSSFRFDWRRDYIPIDAGFSPNNHKNKHKMITMQGHPIVEILAAVGLTNARPHQYSKLKYSYGVPGIINADLYDPIFLRASLGSREPPFPGMPFRLFTMQLGWPGREGDARCITHTIEET